MEDIVTLKGLRHQEEEASEEINFQKIGRVDSHRRTKIHWDKRTNLKKELERLPEVISLCPNELSVQHSNVSVQRLFNTKVIILLVVGQIFFNVRP